MQTADPASIDRRYEYVRCPHCRQRIQRIDWGSAAHALTCPEQVRQGQPGPEARS